MKTELLILISIFFIGCKTLDKKRNVNYAKKGEIVFKKRGNIFDSKLYNESVLTQSRRISRALKEQIIKEREKANIPLDTAELNLTIKMSERMTKKMLFDPMFSSKELLYFNKLQDSLIISYQKNKNKIVGDYLVINPTKNSFYYLSKNDSLTKSKRKINITSIDSKNLELKELKEDRKEIKGYDCFKVEATLEENLDDLFKIRVKYKMYVTDLIRINNHPIIKNKEILSKYYPLEVEEIYEGIDGAKVNYSLEKINIVK